MSKDSNIPQSERELYVAVGEMRTDIKWLVDTHKTHKQHHARIEYSLYIAFILAITGIVVGFI
jgi:hypothetical protein